MKIVLQTFFVIIIVVLVISYTQSKYTIARKIIETIQNTTDEIKQTDKKMYEIKIPVSLQCKLIYFYPYTNFDNLGFDKSIKDNLRTISFSIESPMIAVIYENDVLNYCAIKLSLKPSRPMPMIWHTDNNTIVIKIKKDSDGSYTLL